MDFTCIPGDLPWPSTLWFLTPSGSRCIGRILFHSAPILGQPLMQNVSGVLLQLAAFDDLVTRDDGMLQKMMLGANWVNQSKVKWKLKSQGSRKWENKATDNNRNLLNLFKLDLKARIMSNHLWFPVRNLPHMKSDDLRRFLMVKALCFGICN